MYYIFLDTFTTGIQDTAQAHFRKIKPRGVRDLKLRRGLETSSTAMLLYRTPPPTIPTTIRGTTAKDERPRRNRSGKVVSPPPQPFAGPPRSVPISPVVVQLLTSCKKKKKTFFHRLPFVTGALVFPIISVSAVFRESFGRKVYHAVRSATECV